MRVYLICALALLPVSLAHLTRFARNDNVPADYTGHKVIRIHPATNVQLDELRKLESDFEMDYWNPVFNDMRPVLTIVDPEREHFFLPALNRSSIKYEIVTNNYQSVVDAERAEYELASRVDARDDSYDYTGKYNNYAAILDQIKFLASKYPTTSKYFSVGTTFEGREIPALEIGSGSKVIFIECGIHSREWVTISFGTWVANKLLSDASLAPLLSNYKFIVVPVLNVDGFVYTYTSRLWRKTRSTQSGTTCLGADPNRNWDTSFCKSGASSNPCSDTYCGKAPFSESEAKAMSDVINKYKASTAAYFAVHSYSQLWMYPYGDKYDNPPNVAELKRISQAGIKAIQAVNGLAFTEGTIANTIYLASGSSADWAYSVAGVKIAFALELRDKGQYGFQLPANQIKPAIDETWAGLIAAINALA